MLLKMNSYVNILNIFNFISIILLFSSTIIIYTNLDHCKYIQICVGLLNIMFIPLLSYTLLNKNKFYDIILLKGIYYIFIGSIDFISGLLLLGIEKNTISIGIILICISIYNILVGIFNEEDYVENILNENTQIQITTHNTNNQDQSIYNEEALKIENDDEDEVFFAAN